VPFFSDAGTAPASALSSEAFVLFLRLVVVRELRLRVAPGLARDFRPLPLSGVSTSPPSSDEPTTSGNPKADGSDCSDAGESAVWDTGFAPPPPVSAELLRDRLERRGDPPDLLAVCGISTCDRSASDVTAGSDWDVDVSFPA